MQTPAISQITEYQEIKKVFLASLVIALSAQICLPLPFTPVPITFQNLAVMLIGATLGPRLGALAVVAYLLEGLCGLPVFAHGGSGPFSLLGPRGGYLLGLIAQAYLVGYVTERERTGWTTMGAFWLAWLVHMGLGVVWLTPFVGSDVVLAMGLLPFIPGAILKSVLFSTYLGRDGTLHPSR